VWTQVGSGRVLRPGTWDLGFDHSETFCMNCGEKSEFFERDRRVGHYTCVCGGLGSGHQRGEERGESDVSDYPITKVGAMDDWQNIRP